MTQYLKTELNFNDTELLSALDDMSFWSAPFGIKLLNLVRYKKNICALDIGFGSGFPLIELAMRLGPTCKVFGIDPWEAARERTKFKLRYTSVQNVELVKGVAERMPFESDFFDLIVSNNGLNNVQDLPKALSECSRVSRRGAQFVFTFNTNRTFAEFYDVFREVLSENGLKELQIKVDDHINQMRKPVQEYEDLLGRSNFRIKKLYEDEFDFKFSDGTAMLNHYFMQIFLSSWKEFVPYQLRENIFQKIENTLNLLSEQRNGYSMNVPFVTIDCQNVKEELWLKL
jgi:ubiquinone/menaquinone biosynthesis C-methylase UbiE